VIYLIIYLCIGLILSFVLFGGKPYMDETLAITALWLPIIVITIIVMTAFFCPLFLGPKKQSCATPV